MVNIVTWVQTQNQEKLTEVQDKKGNAKNIAIQGFREP